MSDTDDDITENEASALMGAAQHVVQLASHQAKAIMPGHVVPGVLSIMETAHASIIAAAVLAQYGTEAADHLDLTLDLARNHLRGFAEMFVENGVKMIESGEIPAEMMEVMPGLKGEEAP